MYGERVDMGTSSRVVVHHQHDEGENSPLGRRSSPILEDSPGGAGGGQEPNLNGQSQSNDYPHPQRPKIVVCGEGDPSNQNGNNGSNGIGTTTTTTGNNNNGHHHPHYNYLNNNNCHEPQEEDNTEFINCLVPNQVEVPPETLDLITPGGGGGGSPIPNFRVEGTGQGDSSVTRTPVILGHGSLGAQLPLDPQEDSFGKSLGVHGESLEDDELFLRSEPLYFQGEEAPVVSLVSCYSEPGGSQGQSRDLGCSVTSSTMTLVDNKACCGSDGRPEVEGIQKENQIPNQRGQGHGAPTVPGHENFPKELDNVSSSGKDDPGKGSKVKDPPQCHSLPVVIGGGSERKLGGVSNTKTHESAGGLTSKPPRECSRCLRRSKSGGSSTQPLRSKALLQPKRILSSSGAHKPEEPFIQNDPTLDQGQGQGFRRKIKSILKYGTTGESSGSGSDKQSSMDSLGPSSSSAGMDLQWPNSGSMVMTRSDYGPRVKVTPLHGTHSHRRHHQSSTTKTKDPVVYNERLRNIENFATILNRVRPSTTTITSAKSKPLSNIFRNSGREEEDEKVRPDLDPDKNINNHHQQQNIHFRGGGPCTLRPFNKSGPGFEYRLSGYPRGSKSMSFIEKGSGPETMERSKRMVGHEGTKSSGGVQRSTSVAVRPRRFPPPNWEPPATRSSALRLMKVQQSKKSSPPPHHMFGAIGSGGGGGGGYGFGLPPRATPTQSVGSGESLGYQSTKCSSSGCGGGHGPGSRGSGSGSSKIQRQTTSSALKRLRNEKGVQTDETTEMTDLGKGSQSQGPWMAASMDQGQGELKRCQETCLVIQQKYEEVIKLNDSLKKSMDETQAEHVETIDFLQSEKSTLGDSLAEAEVEIKRLNAELTTLRDDYNDRYSVLEKHYHEAVEEAKAKQELISRIQSNCDVVMSHQRNGLMLVSDLKRRLIYLTDQVLSSYDIPKESLVDLLEAIQSLENNKPGTENIGSMLSPLISALSNTFKLSTLPKDPEQGHLDHYEQFGLNHNEGGALNNEKLKAALSKEVSNLDKALKEFTDVVRAILYKCDKRLFRCYKSATQILEPQQPEGHM